MSNRIRTYIFGVFLLSALISLFFMSTFVNERYRHDAHAVSFSELTPEPEEQAIIVIGNHAGGIGSLERLNRPPQVLRSDGTVLLDAERLGVEFSSNANPGSPLYIDFKGFQIENGERYIAAAVAGQEPAKTLQLYAVTPQTTLEKVDLGNACQRRESQGFSSCSIMHLSGAPNTDWRMMQGYRSGDDNGSVENGISNNFVSVFNAKTKAVRQLNLLQILQDQDIPLNQDINWNVYWKQDDSATLLIQLSQYSDGESKVIGLVAYKPETGVFEKQFLTAETTVQAPFEQSVNPVNIFPEPQIHREFGITHRVQFTRSNATKVLIGEISWKGINTPYTSIVYPLQSGDSQHKFLVIINDYVYVYDSSNKKYALLTMLPFMSPKDMLVYSVDVFLPKNNAQ